MALADDNRPLLSSSMLPMSNQDGAGRTHGFGLDRWRTARAFQLATEGTDDSASPDEQRLSAPRSNHGASEAPSARDGVESRCSPPTVLRASVNVRGLMSPRAAQNVFIRLMKMKGVQAFKCDLRPNIITVDFQPGVDMTAIQVRDEVIRAGWTPGGVELHKVPLYQATKDEMGSDWYILPEFGTGSAFMRWVYLNLTPWNIRKSAYVDPPGRSQADCR